MPNKIMHTENFRNMGGINNKLSPYDTSVEQFLNLKNVDFQQPGALSQRWGSTQYIAQNFSGPVNSIYEFTRLDGFSGIFIGISGGLYFGSSNISLNGISLSTQLQGFSSYISINFMGYFANAVQWLDQSGFWKTGEQFPINPAIGGQQIIAPMHQGSNKNDYVTFNNEVYFCDGNKFVRSSGITFSPVGLPYLASQFGDFGAVNNITMNVGLGLTGVYVFAASYVNEVGFEGPLTPMAFIPAGSLNGATIASEFGSTWLTAQMRVLMPSGYPVKLVNVYSYWFNETFTSDELTTLGTSASFQGIWDYPYCFQFGVDVTSVSLMNFYGCTFIGLSGSTFLQFVLGYSAGNYFSVVDNDGSVFIPNTYNLLSGITLNPYSPSTAAGSTFVITQVSPFPSMIENYQNRLALGGFSGIPSSLILSEIGNGEAFPEDLQFEVRTNDGDVLSGLKTYNQRLYCFKRQAVYEFTGDNETNFTLRLITTEYGSLNNRSIEVYSSGSGDLMAFLDSKGVMQFNGAAMAPLSDAVQPIFQTMNLTAAIDTAIMVHDKQRNQLMLGIPVNGATLNNLTMVYDYLVRAWTTYDGFNPSSFQIVKERFNLPTLVYGSFSGTALNFGASYPSDNGIGFTLLAKTRFLHDMGDTVEKQFRRLWFNMSEVNNATTFWDMKFYQDYGSSMVYRTTMGISQFQNRIDFGVPAKSLSFEFYHYDPNTIVKIYGFGTGHRFQRDV